MNMQNNGNTQDNNANQYQNYYEQNGMNNQFNQNYNPQNIPINSQGTYKILSIISLVCGLLSFFMCIAVIPGIICRGIVIQKNKKDILATIGIILSVLSILFSFIMICVAQLGIGVLQSLYR